MDTMELGRQYTQWKQWPVRTNRHANVREKVRDNYQQTPMQPDWNKSRTAGQTPAGQLASSPFKSAITRSCWWCWENQSIFYWRRIKPSTYRTCCAAKSAGETTSKHTNQLVCKNRGGRKMEWWRTMLTSRDWTKSTRDNCTTPFKVQGANKLLENNLWCVEWISFSECTQKRSEVS